MMEISKLLNLHMILAPILSLRCFFHHLSLGVLVGSATSPVIGSDCGFPTDRGMGVSGDRPRCPRVGRCPP